MNTLLAKQKVSAKPRRATPIPRRSKRSGMAAAIVAAPLSFCITLILVLTGNLSLIWALPVYSVMGAGILALLLALP
ncbi:hypothetical protein SAMN05444004_10842 [Jannaschia faecimaris]|uniref:Uncharacterized protein n=1 Tax=Jannaschia faecimaris TaxID=1244108 RepID=A0A1H3RAN8_9RHOB|nr:hypothetical protein [Jannaschia faecimaris]SDZ22892.1 hypothetical protein SAMN05444004_10842 [Jannaschia faecimaris]